MDKTEHARKALPEAVLAAWPHMTGMELVRAMSEGRVPYADPSLYALLGLRISAVEGPGRVSVVWEPTHALQNFGGTVHGGYLALFFDEVCCAAGASHCERAYPMLTMHLDIDFAKEVHPERAYAGKAEVVHRGKQRMIINSSLSDPGGALVAQATAILQPNLAIADNLNALDRTRSAC